MSAFDRRRAEALAQALEPRAGSVSGHSPGSPAREAVALARRLQDTGTTLERSSAPGEQFRAALRTRLVAVATVRSVTDPAVAAAAAGDGRARTWRGTRVQKGAAVAVGAFASVIAVSGAAVASGQALPGDPLYGLKRTAEQAQLRIAGGPTDEGTRHLQFAATRLDELTALAVGRADEPDWDRVRETLADMDDETRSGSSLLEGAWRDGGDPRVLDVLRGFMAEQSAGLQALMPAMAPAVLDEARASLALVGELAGTTQQLLGGELCGPGCTRAPGGGDPSCDCPPVAAGGGTDEPSAPPSGPASPPAGSPPPSASTTAPTDPSAPPSTSPSAGTSDQPSNGPLTQPSTQPSTTPSRDEPALPSVPPSTVPVPAPVPSKAPSPDLVVPGFPLDGTLRGLTGG